MRPALLLLLTAVLGAVESETWRPADHPATVPRVLAGWTEPLRTVDLAAEVAARVVAVAVEEGERTTSAPVVRLETDLADLAVVAAAANVAQAQAQVEAARREADRASEDQAQATRDRQRAEQIGPTISGQELDAARLAERRAQADADAAEARRSAALAAQRAAETALATAQAQRRRYEVAAPAGWTVVRRHVEPGAQASPGAPLLTLADTATLVLRLRADEAEIAALRQGPIAVHFPATGVTAPAALRRVDVRFDPASRKRLVEVELPGSAAPEASGGLAAEVTVQVPDPAGGWRVPARWVLWTLEQPTVVKTDGTRLPVLVQRRGADEVVISGTGLPRDLTLRAP